MVFSRSASCMNWSNSSARFSVVSRSSPYIRPTKRRYSIPVKRSNRPIPSGTTPIWRFTSMGFLEVDAQQFHASGSGREQARQHFDGGGFAGAVGSQETKELTGGYLQVHVVHSGQRTKAPCQTLRCDRDIGHIDRSFPAATRATLPRDSTRTAAASFIVGC